MNPLKRLEIVKESTLDTQKVIQELFEFTRTQQSNAKELAEHFGSKNLSEVKKTRDRLKKQIQHEKDLMKRVESILNKQEIILRQEWMSNHSGIAYEIRSLLDSISDQNSSIRILKTMLVSLELRIDRLEKNYLKGSRTSAWFK